MDGHNDRHLPNFEASTAQHRAGKNSVKEGKTTAAGNIVRRPPSHIMALETGIKLRQISSRVHTHLWMLVIGDISVCPPVCVRLSVCYTIVLVLWLNGKTFRGNSFITEQNHSSVTIRDSDGVTKCTLNVSSVKYS